MSHDPIESLRRKRTAVRDGVRAIVSGTGRGIVVRGRHGPATEHLVEKTLKECEKDYEWFWCAITQEALFQIFCRSRHQYGSDVVVLSDVPTTLLADPRSVEILVASLEAPPVVSDHSVLDSEVWDEQEIICSGSIIAIAEMPKDSDAPAILSELTRLFGVVDYDPTDHELECFYSSRDTEWLKHVYGHWHGMDREAEAELRRRGLNDMQLGEILFETQTPMNALSKYRLTCDMHPSWNPPREVFEKFLLGSACSPDLAVAVACYAVMLKKEKWRNAEHLLMLYDTLNGRDRDPFVKEYFDKYMQGHTP